MEHSTIFSAVAGLVAGGFGLGAALLGFAAISIAARDRKTQIASHHRRLK